MLIKISLSLLSCAAVAVNFVGLHKILDQVAVYYSNKINLSLVFRRELYSSIFASTCWICKKLYRLSSWGRTLWSEKKFDLIFDKRWWWMRLMMQSQICFSNVWYTFARKHYTLSSKQGFEAFFSLTLPYFSVLYEPLLHPILAKN